MSAGSSRDIGAKEINGFVISVTEPLVVEIDTEATAAYVRLRSGNLKVARTEPFVSDAGFVMLDFDADGQVIGIEIVGMQEFGIHELARFLPLQASDEVLNRTRYVAAKVA